MFSSDGNGITTKPITYGDLQVNLRTAVVSHNAVEKFAKNINIGEIHIIPGYSGVYRAVTALTT